MPDRLHRLVIPPFVFLLFLFAAELTSGRPGLLDYIQDKDGSSNLASLAVGASAVEPNFNLCFLILFVVMNRDGEVYRTISLNDAVAFFAAN